MLPRSLWLGRHGIEQSRRLPRVTTPHFSLSYGFLGEDAGCAVIVPKKAVKGAVRRHWVKRRVREILRNLSVTPGSPSVLVVAARAGSEALTFEQMQNELSTAFNDILAST